MSHETETLDYLEAPSESSAPQNPAEPIFPPEALKEIQEQLDAAFSDAPSSDSSLFDAPTVEKSNPWSVPDPDSPYSSGELSAVNESDQPLQVGIAPSLQEFPSFPVLAGMQPISPDDTSVHPQIFVPGADGNPLTLEEILRQSPPTEKNMPSPAKPTRPEGHVAASPDQLEALTQQHLEALTPTLLSAQSNFSQTMESQPNAPVNYCIQISESNINPAFARLNQLAKTPNATTNPNQAQSLLEHYEYFLLLVVFRCYQECHQFISLIIIKQSYFGHLNSEQEDSFNDQLFTRAMQNVQNLFPDQTTPPTQISGTHLYNPFK